VNKLCEDFGIEYPIFAFSHCRDVVAAVSRAGGMGVFGVLAYSPEQIEIELDWLDRHSAGRPYGVDVVVPVKTVDREQNLTGPADDLRALIPAEHWEFAESLMAEHGVPRMTAQERDAVYGRANPTTAGFTAGGGAEQIDVVLAHRSPFVVSALGPPPAYLVDRVRGYGGKVGTLVGTVPQAVRGVDAGADVIICQSYEAAAHTGEIGSMVLTPDVVDAVGEVPVLAAGGIGSGRQMAAAMSLGAKGVWTGSVWLTTKESSADPRMVERMIAMGASDTVRSRAQTGKPNRQMRTAWTQAWDDPRSPGPLPAPLQYILYAEYLDRARRAGVLELVGGPVGQIVGRMNRVRSVADVLGEIVEEYISTIERMAAVLQD
jgi:NAD(P)H-dependent flavin oxidoreductase YrpB (nitropropane dioxygenase family)